MSNIEVTYEGDYPCACMGRLIIKENGIEIYNKEFCCSSTGSAGFTEDWDAVVESGTLIWNDAEKFSKEIQEAVADELSCVSVCCGGCI